MTKYKVLDLSRWQTSFDVAAARGAGVDCIILRHAYGTDHDHTALGWASSIITAGLPLGGYGFATWHYKRHNGGSIHAARALMHQQVTSWINAARQSGCHWWFALDQELEQSEQMGLSKTDNTVLINEACEILQANDLHPCLYCSPAWDANYVKTSMLTVPYWMARYVDGHADFDDAGADLMQLPAGKYTDWMRKLYAAGRLIGWQFASNGRGAQYGAASANIDRSIFYADPADDPDILPDVEAQSDAQYIQIGPLAGDGAAAVRAQLDKLAIPYDALPASADQCIMRTTVAASTGDQVALIQLATTLGVPIQLADTPFADAELPPQDTEPYSVIWMAAVVKGGFASRSDAVDYIEAVLGKDAMDKLAITVAREV